MGMRVATGAGGRQRNRTDGGFVSPCRTDEKCVTFWDINKVCDRKVLGRKRKRQLGVDNDARQTNERKRKR